MFVQAIWAYEVAEAEVVSGVSFPGSNTCLIYSGEGRERVLSSFVTEKLFGVRAPVPIASRLYRERAIVLRDV
jgi:hypothetical protein